MCSMQLWVRINAVTYFPQMRRGRGEEEREWEREREREQERERAQKQIERREYLTLGD